MRVKEAPAYSSTPPRSPAPPSHAGGLRGRISTRRRPTPLLYGCGGVLGAARRALAPLAVACLLLAAATAVVASADIYVRRAQFTAQLNWTGPVLLELPESLIEGATGLYVSNTSTCSYMLTTYWTVIGKNAYIVFDPGVNITAGQRYTYYICYGDLIAPNHEDLAACMLPGSCNISYTESGANLTNTSAYVDFSNRLESNSTSITGSGATSYTAVLLNESVGRVYITGVDSNFTTMVNQSYNLVLRDADGAEWSGAYSLADKQLVRNDTVTFDTGYWYADTGNVTVYDAGSEVYATSGYIAVNVYDSDRDTYYLLIYLDDRLYKSFYEVSSVNVSLAGQWFRTVTIRVYDTEGNDWVRAWGEVHVEVYNYTYTLSAEPNVSMTGPVNATVAAGDGIVFNIDGNVSASYYRYRLLCGNVTFNTTQFLYVAKQVSGNATAAAWGTGYAYTGIVYGSTVEAVAGSNRDSSGYAGGILLAGSPDAASAAVTETGVLLGVFADTYPSTAERLNITVCVYAAVPGRYAANWSQLLVFNALSNYTDYLVSPASLLPSTAGSTAGNATVYVTVNAGLDPDLTLAIKILLIALPFMAGLFFFYKAVSTDANIWIAMTLSAFSLSSIMAYVFGFYDEARGLLALDLVATYPVLERSMDWLIRLIFRRRR